MKFTTIKVSGREALSVLEEYRSRYVSTGQYAFLIGGEDDLERLEESAEYVEKSSQAIIEDSFREDIDALVASRSGEVEPGEWPGSIANKGSMSLHMDLLTRDFKPEVILGLATIEKPWHLPAILKYGNWNDCPATEIHCAFHRRWLDLYGAEITGMSGNVIECRVANPPRDQESAMRLAWEQYVYCSDIVDQGCGSIANLAGTLLDSPYWFFWWD